MAPKKGQHGFKGKQPTKRKAPRLSLPVDSPSSEEELVAIDAGMQDLEASSGITDFKNRRSFLKSQKDASSGPFPKRANAPQGQSRGFSSQAPTQLRASLSTFVQPTLYPQRVFPSQGLASPQFNPRTTHNTVPLFDEPGATHNIRPPSYEPSTTHNIRPPFYEFNPGTTHSGHPPYDSSLPFGEPVTYLGYHLLPATIDKILKWEYVDIFSLLNRESEDNWDEEEASWKRPDRCWDNWFPAFLIYAGVLTRSQPEHGLSLIAYLDIIYRAYMGFCGDAWLLYDEAFRRSAAVSPKCWGKEDINLWLRFMTVARPGASDRFDSGHLIVDS